MTIIAEYADIIQRNIGVLDWEEQNKIKGINVSIAGLDDQGISSVLVAKIGFNKINVIDNSKVELVDLNTEFLATIDRISQNKADVAKDVIEKHNPLIACDTFKINDTITVDDAKEALKDSHYCIIPTKNPYMRIAMARAAEELGIPYVVCMDIGFKVFLCSFENGNDSFEKFTRTANSLSQCYEGGEDIMGKSIPVASSFIANLSVAEVVKMVIGKGKIHYAPESYTMDLLTWKPWRLP